MFKISAFILLVVLCIGCKKDALPEEHYFGTVSVKVFNLPGTPEDIDVKFDGALIGTVHINTTQAIKVAAGKAGKLSFYEKGSDSLLFDSTITIPKNATAVYQVAFSKETGIYGFISAPPAVVADDSCFVQVLDNLDPAFYSDPIDLELFLLDGDTYETTPLGIVFKDITRNKVSMQGFMIGAQPTDADGNALNKGYVWKLKDHNTGQYVYQSMYGADWFIISPNLKNSIIVVLTSDADGNALPNNINLTEF